MTHQYQDLIKLFQQVFYKQYNTCLVKGDDEPIYIPANKHCDHHQIIFAHGFYRSALHEISHWCIAGEARRLLEDFGYWYQPDGRSASEQKTFESVEIKPQAIEWAFSVAAKIPFNVSADNLNGCGSDTTAFTLQVHKQVQCYLKQGFPPRAQKFIDALCTFYGVSQPLTLADFVLDKELFPHV